MHDKSWLWLGLTVHQMVMVTTGTRGVAGRKGGGCCLPVMRWQHFHFNADSISTSLTGEASSYALLQSAEGGTGEGGAGLKLSAWNYLATLCSSKLLLLPLLHIACHTYCVSSRYNYACSVYLLRLLWLPSRLLDRTLKQTFAAAAAAAGLMLPQVFASPFVDNFWQAINTHRSYAACTKQIKFVNIESG